MTAGSRRDAAGFTMVDVLELIAGLSRGVYGGTIWLVAAALIGAVVPFTLLVIAQTNRRLLDPTRDRRSAETRARLETWGRLHSVRTALSIISSILFIWAATRR